VFLGKPEEVKEEEARGTWVSGAGRATSCCATPLSVGLKGKKKEAPLNKVGGGKKLFSRRKENEFSQKRKRGKNNGRGRRGPETVAKDSEKCPAGPAKRKGVGRGERRERDGGV